MLLAKETEESTMVGKHSPRLADLVDNGIWWMPPPPPLPPGSSAHCLPEGLWGSRCDGSIALLLVYPPGYRPAQVIIPSLSNNHLPLNDTLPWRQACVSVCMCVVSGGKMTPVKKAPESASLLLSRQEEAMCDNVNIVFGGFKKKKKQGKASKASSTFCVYKCHLNHTGCVKALSVCGACFPL